MITPIASEEMDSVRMSSGAMTAFETRKNWLAMNAAQSTASIRAATRDRAEESKQGSLPVPALPRAGLSRRGHRVASRQPPPRSISRAATYSKSMG